MRHEESHRVYFDHGDLLLSVRRRVAPSAMFAKHTRSWSFQNSEINAFFEAADKFGKLSGKWLNLDGLSLGWSPLKINRGH